MRPLEHLFGGAPWVGVALFQATLMAGLAALLWLGSRRWGPATRAALLLAGLLGALVTPVIGSVSPVWVPVPEPTVSLPLLHESSTDDPWTEEMPTGTALKLPALEPTPIPPVEADEKVTRWHGDKVTASPASPVLSETADGPASPITLSPGHRVTLSSILLAAWLLGVVVFLLRAIVGLAALELCRRRSVSIADEECLASVHRLASSVELRECPLIGSPLTLGLRRSIILLPAAWRDWSPGQRELILAHELAHVRRRDFLAGLVAELIVCVYWFHPLVRWLAGRLRLEQEFAADACAASVAETPKHYLRCLARLALEMDQGPVPLAPAFWRRRPEILRRIHMLRNTDGRHPTTLGRATSWTLALLALAAYVAVAGLGFAADEPKNAKPAEVKVLKDLHGDALPQGAVARGGSVRFRHSSSAIAYSPDGKVLASGGHDNQIRLFDAATGKEIRTLTGHQKRLYQPDDPKNIASTLVSATGDGFVCSVAFSPDGKTLASGGWDDCIRLWDVATGKEVRKIDAHKAMVTRVVFSPDGKFLASRGGIDGTAKLWDPTTGTLLQKFTGLNKINPWRFNHDAALAISPDSKTVAVTARNQLVFFDVASGRELKRLDSHVYGITLAYSHDGKLLATGGVDPGKDVYSLRIWDVAAGKELRRCTLPKNEPPTYLAFPPSSNDRLAAVVAEDNMHIFDVETGKSVVDLKHYWPSRLAYSPNGKTVTSAGSGPVIRHFESATGKELFQEFDGHQAGVAAVVLSPDGKLAASGGEAIRLWDPATGKALKKIAVKGGVTSLAFSPDSRTLASAGRDRIVHLWDTNSGEQVKELKGHKNQLCGVAFSPDGKLLASGDVQSTIRIWNLENGTELQTIDNKSGTEALSLAFNPDSKALACAGAWNDSSFLPKPGTTIKINGKEVKIGDGINIQGVMMTRKEGYFVLMWDVNTGKELRKFGGLTEKIRSLAFTADGKTLAAGSRDGKIALWDTESGKERLFCLAHPTQREGTFQASPSIAFTPDSKSLVSASTDRTLRVWDATSGKELRQYRTPTGALTALSLAKDGKTLATGSSDSTVLFWDITLPPPAQREGSHVITLQ